MLNSTSLCLFLCLATILRAQQIDSANRSWITLDGFLTAVKKGTLDNLNLYDLDTDALLDEARYRSKGQFQWSPKSISSIASWGGRKGVSLTKINLEDLPDLPDSQQVKKEMAFRGFPDFRTIKPEDIDWSDVKQKLRKAKKDAIAARKKRLLVSWGEVTVIVVVVIVVLALAAGGVPSVVTGPSRPRLE